MIVSIFTSPNQPIGDPIAREWQEFHYSKPKCVAKKNVHILYSGFYPDTKGEPEDITQPVCKLCIRCDSVRHADPKFICTHVGSPSL